MFMKFPVSKIFDKIYKKHPGLFPCIAQVHLLGSGFGYFFECFGILSASLISIFWVLSSKYFGFNAADERSLLEICIYSISKFPLLYSLGTYYLDPLDRSPLLVDFSPRGYHQLSFQSNLR